MRLSIWLFLVAFALVFYGGILHRELCQLPIMAPNRGKRIPCISSSCRGFVHHLWSGAGSSGHGLNTAPFVLPTASYSGMGDLAGYRITSDHVGF
jgi:hypothetical protein